MFELLIVIVPFSAISIGPGIFLATPTSVTKAEAGLDLSRGSMSTRKSRSRVQKLAPRCASFFRRLRRIMNVVGR